MKRNKIKNRPVKATRPADTAITGQPPNASEMAVLPGKGILRGLVLAAVVSIGVGCAFLLAREWTAQPNAAENIIHRFVKLRASRRPIRAGTAGSCSSFR